MEAPGVSNFRLNFLEKDQNWVPAFDDLALVLQISYKKQQQNGILQSQLIRLNADCAFQRV